jgi:hypothetical protein
MKRDPFMSEATPTSIHTSVMVFHGYESLEEPAYLPANTTFKTGQLRQESIIKPLAPAKTGARRVEA